MAWGALPRSGWVGSGLLVCPLPSLGQGKDPPPNTGGMYSPLFSEMPPRDLKPTTAVKTHGFPCKQEFKTCSREHGAVFVGPAELRERSTEEAQSMPAGGVHLHEMWRELLACAVGCASELWGRSLQQRCPAS